MYAAASSTLGSLAGGIGIFTAGTAAELLKGFPVYSAHVQAELAQQPRLLTLRRHHPHPW